MIACFALQFCGQALSQVLQIIGFFFALKVTLSPGLISILLFNFDIFLFIFKNFDQLGQFFFEFSLKSALPWRLVFIIFWNVFFSRSRFLTIVVLNALSAIFSWFLSCLFHYFSDLLTSESLLGHLHESTCLQLKITHLKIQADL